MANPLDEEQDPDAGSTHLKNFMTERQSHAYGSLAQSGNDMLRDRQPRNRGDSYYEEKYGKGTDLSPAESQSVNRRSKGNRG